MLVGFCRTYRGMHHPSDVIGGALLGACWLAAVHRVVLARAGGTRERRRPEGRSVRTREADQPAGRGVGTADGGRSRGAPAEPTRASGGWAAPDGVARRGSAEPA
ncbi:phosphatase PAP2 family protein [Frankia sp. AiPs1]|uniref:phosphatase PAP2 family protein n=1 Tax=Frankia sp. AiPs1 TaxID=573493 RepID=UPI002043F204|nr:phosphatase PAP2 family protein [Frankia sp. AiPs1]MCM3925874.1 phosphatase PAP2 family protein [Frankia sp. AiPs1]